MNILAIDAGTKCGWAAWKDGKLESGVMKFEMKRGESAGMRFIRFNAWLRDMLLVKIWPEMVIYEMAHHRGGAATELTIGMVTRIQEECERRKIEYSSVHSAMIKKFATGKGSAEKKEMIKEARRRFNINIIDDNHADALLILAWAKEEFNKGEKG